MECLQSVLSAIATGEDATASLVALTRVIRQGEISVDQLVKGVEVALAKAEVPKRDALCQVVRSAVKPLLTQLAARDRLFLTAFFTGRLQDWSCLLSGLQGCQLLISSLSPQDPATTEILLPITDAFVASLDVQSLKQSHRWAALHLLQELLRVLNPVGDALLSDALEVIIRSIDGEKDPRCLLLTFQLVQSVTALYKDAALMVESAEELFDVISCYFPITDTEDFEMEGNIKITCTELVKGLHQAMTSTAEFAEYCLPLLLEKLTSDHRVARVAALQCVKCSVGTFPVDVLSGYFRAMWSELKELIFGKVDPELESIALQTSQALCQLTPPTGMEGEMFFDLIFLDEHVSDLIPRIKNHGYQSLTKQNPVVAWSHPKTAAKTVDALLKPLLQDFIELYQNSSFDEPDDGDEDMGLQMRQYLLAFHCLLHELCWKLHQHPGTLSHPRLLREALTAFLTQLKRSLDELAQMEGCSDAEAVWEHIWFLRMELLYLSLDFQFLTQDDWTVLLQSLLAHLTGVDHSRSEGSHEMVLKLFSALLQDTDSESSELRWKHRSLVKWSLLQALPEGGSVVNIREAISLEELINKSIQFQLLDVLTRDSSYGRQQLWQLLDCNLAQWLQLSLKDPHKQVFLAGLLRFLVTSVFPMASTGASEFIPPLLQPLLDFSMTPEILQNEGKQLEGCLVEELRCSLCVLTQKSSLREQTGTQNSTMAWWQTLFLAAYERVQDQESGSVGLVWKHAVFCGTPEVRAVLPETSSAMDFFSSCLETATASLKDSKHRVQLYQSSAAAAFHLLHTFEDLDTLTRDCIQPMKAAMDDRQPSSDVMGIVLLSCASLKALLSNSQISHSAARLATESLLPPLITLLHQTRESKEIQLGVLLADGVQFLISDDSSDPPGSYKTLVQSSVWQSSLQRQRGFSLCLSQVITKLEAKSESEGALIALGCLLRGAGNKFVNIEGQRVLPWILHLIELLLTEAQAHALLISSLRLLQTLLQSPGEATRALKHEIMRSLMHSAAFEASSEVRVLALSSLSLCLESLLSTNDLELYRQRMRVLLDRALDDRKRCVRSCAVRVKLLLVQQ